MLRQGLEVAKGRPGEELQVKCLSSFARKRSVEVNRAGLLKLMQVPNLKADSKK